MQVSLNQCPLPYPVIGGNFRLRNMTVRRNKARNIHGRIIVNGNYHQVEKRVPRVTSSPIVLLLGREEELSDML